jgi:hypothetical protein
MRFAPTLIIPFLVLSAQLPALAQTPSADLPDSGPGLISGAVSDAEGQHLSGVAVTVRSDADSALVTGVMTDQDGRFRVEGLQLGSYRLHVATIGYQSRTSEVIELTADAAEVDLGEIQLESAPIELEGIEAVAERATMVVEADRTTYNARAMPVAASGTAIDVLRSVPELEVDVDNNVRLRGNRPVAIHLNGRPTPMSGEELANFLEQLPGDRIERVEVMPNPSARYDPEGMGGIVNIILRDDVELGLSGSLSLNASTRNRQSLNGRFNVQRGRLTLFSGAGANLYRYDWLTQTRRQNLVTDPVTIIEQNSISDGRQDGWNLDWTAEMRVGEQATVWSSARIFRMGSSAEGVTKYDILVDEANRLEERYDRRNDSDYTWNSHNFDFGFKQVFEAQRHELTIDGRITRGDNDNETVQTRLFHILASQPVDRPLELTLNDVDAGSGNLSIQGDYVRPLGEARLELGYRAWQRDQDNDNLLRIFATQDASNPEAREHGGYDYRETFHSLYATYGRTIGDFGFQAGLRAELSSTRFHSAVADTALDRDYNSLFPSFNVSYTLEQGRTLRFLYSRRISRPSAFYLDPFVPSTDPLNRFFGNPDLKPSYTQSFSIDYSWTGQIGTLRVEPYYRRTNDMWERIQTVGADGVATTTWQNSASARAFGSNFTVSLASGGRISGSTNLSVYRDQRDGTNLGDYRNAATLVSFGGNMGIRLGENLTAQINANHFPSSSILQGRDSGYTWSTLALRQQIWNGKGTLSLNVVDPLNLNTFDSWSQDASYVQESRSSFTSRVVTLGLSYNFGTQPDRQSRPGQDVVDEPAGATIPVPSR